MGSTYVSPLSHLLAYLCEGAGSRWESRVKDQSTPYSHQLACPVKAPAAGGIRGVTDCFGMFNKLKVDYGHRKVMTGIYIVYQCKEYSSNF